MYLPRARMCQEADRRILQAHFLPRRRCTLGTGGPCCSHTRLFQLARSRILQCTACRCGSPRWQRTFQPRTGYTLKRRCLCICRACTSCSQRRSQRRIQAHTGRQLEIWILLGTPYWPGSFGRFLRCQCRSPRHIDLRRRTCKVRTCPSAR